MKKILIVSDIDMKRLDSGTDFYANFLKECLERNYYVEFILPTEPCALVKEKLKQGNLTYTVLQNWWRNTYEGKRNNIRITIPIVRKIITKNIDLVAFNFCSELTALIVAFLTFILFKKPRIIWHQHSEIEEIGRGFSLKRYISRLKVLSMVIDLVCPVYKKQEQILRLRGIDGRKIVTLYNGTNLGRFDQIRNTSKIKSELCIPTDYKIVVTIGSLIQRKGINYFIEAAGLVLAKYPQTVFLIIGEGNLLQELKNQTKDLKVENSVHFLGKRSDVANILAICDIFVLASLAEPFGLVNIEAMAAGKPIIATTVGGIPEIIEDKASGFLVPTCDSKTIADKIIYLLDNYLIAQNMGRRGREIVEEKFTIGKMVSNYLSVYRKLLIGEV